MIIPSGAAMLEKNVPPFKISYSSSPSERSNAGRKSSSATCPSGAAMLGENLPPPHAPASAAMLGEDFPLLHPPASAAMLEENVPPSHFSPLMRIFEYDLLQIR